MDHGVTPCMGVWIETVRSCSTQPGVIVTPCMGVWIETVSFLIELFAVLSHPVWVCGLKLFMIWGRKQSESHTLYGCVD